VPERNLHHRGDIVNTSDVQQLRFTAALLTSALSATLRLIAVWVLGVDGL
jgi:hypothetical protein